MWKIPPETVQHSRTWMAWPWDSSIWNPIPGTSLEACQSAIDRVIRSILNYENVALIVRACDACKVEQRFKPTSDRRHEVEIVVASYNDIWVRDTLPTFAIGSSGSLFAINWNFNGWGRRARPYAAYGDDAQLCRKIATLVGAKIIDSKIIAEGGAFSFDEDHLTVATRSVMFDRSRNPNSTKAQLEEALIGATGRQKICWLPGDRSEPITSGHADSLIAFAAKQNALINWASDETRAEFDICDYNLRVFQGWLERESPGTNVIRLPAATCAGGYNHCPSYINFAHVNGGIIVPEYGDFEGDRRARIIISEAFESKLHVESIDVKAIASAGGGIHCVTLQQPFSGC